jgi:predicted metal-dependent hydrolase
LSVPAKAFALRLPDGRDLDGEVRNRRGTKRLTLRVDAVARRLIVSGPMRVPQRDVQAFIRQNLDWIAARMDAWPAATPFQDGGAFLLRGVPTRLVCVPGRARPALIAGEDDALPRLEIAGTPTQLPTRTRQALKAFAHNDAMTYCDAFSAVLGKAPSAVRLRDTKSRWGSCNSKGEIMLSWRLIGAPPHVFEYVVAHEMAHLLELNHSPRFWAQVETLMPNWKPARHWLKTHGTQLHQIGAA